MDEKTTKMMKQVTTHGFDIYDAHKRYLPASIVETGSLVQCTACSMRRSVLACSMRSQGSRGWWQRVFHDSPGGCDAFGSTTASIGEPVHCSGPWRAMSTLRHTANAKTGHIAQPALSGDGAELRRRSSVGPHRSLHVERGALRAGDRPRFSIALAAAPPGLTLRRCTTAFSSSL